MLRVRFEIREDDYRPVRWPIKHPYWCTGSGGSCDDDGESYNILVTYVDSEEELYENWPDAENLDIMSEESEYSFSSRFPRPEWLDATGG